jgi:hypothetical protein
MPVRADVKERQNALRDDPDIFVQKENRDNAQEQNENALYKFNGSYGTKQILLGALPVECRG